MESEAIDAAGRFEWERIVRRVSMPAAQKLLAFVLASYADSDGSRVRPGNDILANVTGQSERSVKRSLAALKGLGLLTVARRGGGRNGTGKTTEYQLSIPSDLLDRDDIDVLPPGERPESGATQVASQNDDSHPVDTSPETVDSSIVDNQSGVTWVASQSDGHEANEGPHMSPQTPNEGPNDHFEGPPGWPTTTHIRPPTRETNPVVTTQGESRPPASPREPPDPHSESVPARTEAA